MLAIDQADLKIRAGPSGLHFFFRNTGLNILCDEIRVPRQGWARAPRQVSIALTNVCDLACPYCYAPKNRAKLNMQRLVGWLDELDANGCLGVGFGGGEPTLHPHFVDLCRYVAEKTKLAVTFTTHAHRLNEALALRLAGNVHFVRVSMDGVEATYEGLRGRPFAALRSSLRIIRGIAPVGINFVVNARTLPDLDDAVKLAFDSGAAEFLLLPEQPVHGVGGIDLRSQELLKNWIEEYRGQVPLTISEAGADGISTCAVVSDETGLKSFAHIDASGVLKRTSYDHDGVSIGSDSLMQALDLLRSRCEEGNE